MQNARIDLLAGVNAAKEELLDVGKDGFWGGNNIIDATGDDAVKAFKELEKAGIYIDTVMGTYGGYVLNQSISIPKRKFSKEDYIFLKNLKVSDDDKEKLEIIADKVHGLYFDSKKEKIELFEDIKKYYNILNRAIKEHRKVKINYYSYTHGNKDRVIRPYDIFLYNSVWGCAAYCELRKDLRHFELKRINDIELLDEKF